MERISSSLTFFYKWLFPLVWFGFLAFFLFQSQEEATTDPLFIAVPVLMAIFGIFIMRKLVWDLADSVDDHGEYLVVRRGRQEARIELKNIMNVSATIAVNPPRVTLRLIEDSVFGNEINFSPKSSFSLNPLAKSIVAEQLMARAFAARGMNASQQ